MSIVPQIAAAGADVQWYAAIATSYLLGAVPFGLILAKRLRGVNLLTVGSGNIGATNAMRTLGRGWGLVSFALDLGKGWVPVALLVPLFGFGDGGAEGAQTLRILCASAAVLGHCFPVYLGFKGGKGVSTACGAILAIDPMVAVLAGVVWIATLKLTRYVGLASILMGFAFPAAAWWLQPEDRPFLVGTCLLTALVVVRHRKNIARMCQGTEPKAGKKEVAGE